jgi:hypothetical protein
MRIYDRRRRQQEQGFVREKARRRAIEKLSAWAMGVLRIHRCA